MARVWEHSLAWQGEEDDSLPQSDALDRAINMGFRAKPETCMQNISALWKSFGTEDATGDMSVNGGGFDIGFGSVLLQTSAII